MNMIFTLEENLQDCLLTQQVYSERLIQLSQTGSVQHKKHQNKAGTENKKN